MNISKSQSVRKLGADRHNLDCMNLNRVTFFSCFQYGGLGRNILPGTCTVYEDAINISVLSQLHSSSLSFRSAPGQFNSWWVRTLQCQMRLQAEGVSINFMYALSLI